MAKCEKCRGVGSVDNHRYWEAKEKYPNTNYYLSFSTLIKCSKCKGFGYSAQTIKDLKKSLLDLKCELNEANLPNINKRVDEILKIIN